MAAQPLRHPGGTTSLEAVPSELSITWAPGITDQPVDSPDPPAVLSVAGHRLVRIEAIGPPRYHSWRYRIEGPLAGDPERFLELARPTVPGALLLSPRYRTGPAEPPRTLLPRVLLSMGDDAPSELLSALLREAQWSATRRRTSAPHEWTLEPAGPRSWAPLDFVERLWSSHLVRWAEADWLVPKAPRWVPADPLFASQWHLENTGQSGGSVGIDLDAPTGWDRSLGDGVVLAVLDGGIDSDHPDLAEVLLPGWDFIDGDGSTDPDGLGSHGTSVAGIAAAPANGVGVVGTCPGCSILPVRMLGVSNSGEADAIDFAVERGAWVINNSWGPADGTGAEQPLPFVVSEAIERAVREGRGGLGTAIFWASGNGAGIDSCSDDGYASDPRVLMVGAATNFGTHAVYSEYCPELDFSTLSAGGSLGIQTTRIDDYRADFGGTSAAAPSASGIGAVVLSALPALDLRSLSALLACAADRIDPAGGDYDDQGHSELYGYGLLQLGATLTGSGNCLVAAQPVSRCESAFPVLLARPGIGGAEPLAATVFGPREPLGERIEFTPDEGALWSALVTVSAVEPAYGDARLSVNHGDIVEVRLDSVLTQTTVTIDCEAPVLGGATFTEIAHDHARIAWTTDTLSTGLVRARGASTVEVPTAGLNTTHERWLFDLEPCTDYVIDIEGADAVGNAAQWPAVLMLRTDGDESVVPADAPNDADPCDPTTWTPEDGPDVGPDDDGGEVVEGGGAGCCEGRSQSAALLLLAALRSRRRRT